MVDLHLHYPMHLRPSRPPLAAVARSAPARSQLVDWFDAGVLGAASHLSNYRSLRSGPAATMAAMRRGGLRVALSVLTLPLLEMGERFTVRYKRRPPYGGPPKDFFFDALLRQMDLVEARVATAHAGDALVARGPAELEQALSTGKLALIHCVEGGFQLGASPQSVRAAVDRLAERGVAYVTLAHLCWRHVATNEPAAPWVSDETYDWMFPQPAIGLAQLGRVAIEQMVARGVTIDVAHMSARALDETFALLDELDPARRVGVIASHVGYRFGARRYNLDAATVERIAQRDGLIGLIFSDAYISDGLGRRTRTFADGFERLCRHVDRIREITGSHRHTCLGSDVDGFIKPALAGFDDVAGVGRLGRALQARYGEDGEMIASENALRFLRHRWGATAVPVAA